jgi:hypothetical protein
MNCYGTAEGEVMHEGEVSTKSQASHRMQGRMGWQMELHELQACLA